MPFCINCVSNSICRGIYVYTPVKSPEIAIENIISLIRFHRSVANNNQTRHLYIIVADSSRRRLYARRVPVFIFERVLRRLNVQLLFNYRDDL